MDPRERLAVANWRTPKDLSGATARESVKLICISFKKNIKYGIFCSMLKAATVNCKLMNGVNNNKLQIS